MRKSGPKPLPDSLKALSGTVQPCRSVAVLFPDHASRPDPDVIDPPKWLPAAAKVIFRAHVEDYRRRGQKVEGFSEALAHYCQLDAEIRAMVKAKRDVPTAMRTSLRGFQAEFYDTPASQVASSGKTARAGNRFGSNGKRPDPA